MAIKKGTLDELLSGRDPKEVFSKDGLFDELKKALAERVLNAELDEHLDGEAAAGKANHRNGYSKKTVLTGSAKLDLRIPRDRQGTFDPKLMGSASPCAQARCLTSSANGPSLYVHSDGHHRLPRKVHRPRAHASAGSGGRGTPRQRRCGRAG